MRLLILLTCCFFQGYSQNNGIYNYRITTPEGQVFPLNEFKGKKMMIVVFPAAKFPTDSLVIAKLDSFSAQYASQVTIIGIPTFEDGYSIDSASSLNQWYRKYTGNFIILSRGVNSRKSNANQDPVFAWLTHASLNGHFDQDIGGSGQVFFINEKGDLYGVVSASAPLSLKVLKKMLQN